MTDYTEYKKLYLLCFTEDTEEDAELLFKNVLSKAKMISENNENGQPIAMLFLMDASIMENGTSSDYYYLYAACTHPDYRGRGIMAGLLEKAKKTAIQNNKLGIFLKPANPPLFKFYAKSNFLPYFNVCKINMSVDEFTKNYPAKAMPVHTTMDNWYGIRKTFLNAIKSSYVNFSKEMLITAADGCIPVATNTFGFVYEVRDRLLLVKEAIFTDGDIKELFSSISYVLKESNCTAVEIRLPPILAEYLTNFEDLLQPFSVMWFSPDTNQPKQTNGHHGFAFD